MPYAVNANLVGVRSETASRALLLCRPARLQAESGQAGCQAGNGVFELANARAWTETAACSDRTQSPSLSRDLTLI